MKLVRFTRDMAPQHVNDERVIPDDVAQRLADEGAVTILGEFPHKPSGNIIADHIPPQLQTRAGHPKRQRFLTK